MDHSNHGDHGNHGGDGGDEAQAGSGCSMIMLFHAGHSECIVFGWWNVKSLEAFIFSALAIFLITVAYEGLKYYREKLYHTKAVELLKSSSTNLTDGQPPRSIRSQMLNAHHLTQSALHTLQIAIAYMLMLMAMTYNAWILLAIVLGAGFGYFFFGWIRQRTVYVEEHCH